jgi:large subunit ribosomal protein L15
MPLGPTRKVYGEVNLWQLNRLEAGAVVTAELLRERGIVNGRHDGLRVLGQGELDRALTVRAIHFTARAKEQIEAAGGTAELIAER